MNKLWQYGFECWRVRNQNFYGDTEEEQEKLLRLDLETLLITYLYDMKEMINPRDSALFLLQRLVRQKHHTLEQKTASMGENSEYLNSELAERRWYYSGRQSSAPPRPSGRKVGGTSAKGSFTARACVILASVCIHGPSAIISLDITYYKILFISLFLARIDINDICHAASLIL